MYDKNRFGIMKSRAFRTFNKKLGVKQIFAALVVSPKKNYFRGLHRLCMDTKTNTKEAVFINL